MIFCNKFGFILETSFSYTIVNKINESLMNWMAKQVKWVFDIPRKWNFSEKKKWVMKSRRKKGFVGNCDPGIGYRLSVFLFHFCFWKLVWIKVAYEFWCQCYKTDYGRKLRTFVMSWSVFPWQAFQVYCLWARPWAYPRVEHLKCSSIGEAPAFPTNIRLFWKGLPLPATLAYYDCNWQH